MLLQYLEEYGSMSFHDQPLNYIDLLAFAGLSYLDYEKDDIGKTLPQALIGAHAPEVDFGNAEDGKELRKIPEKLGDAVGRIFHREVLTGKHVVMESECDRKLANRMASSPRYRNVRLVAFESEFREKVKQFAAMALTLGDTLIVVYRGTDETTTGWEEALRLSLREPVGAHVDAVDFLEKAVRGEFAQSKEECGPPNIGPQAQSQTRIQGPIIVCGHSKGGNLAEYASTLVAGESEEFRTRLAQVVSFDGPGLPPEMRQTPAYAEIAPRLKTFIPKSSFIGKINDHAPESIVFIESDKHFMDQHIIYSWKTKGTHFVTCRQSLTGRITSSGMGLLVDGLDDSQKSGLFDTIFAVPRFLGKKKLS